VSDEKPNASELLVLPWHGRPARDFWHSKTKSRASRPCHAVDQSNPITTIELPQIRYSPSTSSHLRLPSRLRGEIFLCSSTDGSPPNTAFGTSQLQRIPGPPPAVDAASGHPVRGWNVVSFFGNYGYRPLVLTPAGAPTRPDGDLVTIRFTGVVGRDPALLLRTTALSTITSDQHWVTTATAETPGVPVFQVGPPLPDPRITAVQATGGHDRPMFYVGDQAPLPGIARGPRGVWRWSAGHAGWWRGRPC
jgi:hypothetical protein